MSDPLRSEDPSARQSAQDALEDEWRRRVTEANLQLHQARQHVRDTQRERHAGGLPLPDGDYAFRQALRAESLALEHYRNVLRTYTDLVLKTKR